MNRWLRAVLLLGLTACADREPAAQKRLFEPTGVPLRLPTESVREWRFDDAMPWTPIEGTPYRLLTGEPPGGLWVGWRDGQATLEIAPELEADNIDALEVELAYPHSSGLELAWQLEGDEEGYPSPQIATLNADDKKIVEGNATYRFELRDLPSWRGKIRSMRLRLRTFGGDGRALLAITALRQNLSGSLWSEWASKVWRVEVDHEIRDAVLSPPGGIFERQVVVTGSSSLRLGFGTLGVPRQALSVGVWAEQKTLRKELLRFELPAGVAPTWTDKILELEGLTGRLRLVFEAKGENALNVRAGLPVWSVPILEVPGAHRSLQRPDIVMISIDTLRADRLEGSAGSRPVASAIAAWGERYAVRFANPIVQATWTLPSHSSMLTGLEVAHHGVNHPRSFLPADRSTLAEELRSLGYHTRALTGGGWLHPRFGLDQGFEHFRYWPTHEDDEELEQGVRHALDALGGSSRPLFLFLHTFSVHEYWRNLPAGPEGGESQVRAQVYDDAVARADRLLQPLLERTSELAEEHPVIVVLTSDHGESLGDPFTPGHGDPVEATLRVPLLIRLPSGAEAGTVIADQVRSIDLVPTILDIIGQRGTARVDGASLLPLLDRRKPSAERQAWTYAAGLSLRIGNRWKYRLRNAAGHPEAGRARLWRLDGEGGEERVAAGAKDLAAFERRARAMLAEVPGLRIEISPPAGRSIKLRLEGLGHVLDHHAVTSLDLPGGALIRLAPDQLELEIPGDGPYTLVLEHLPQPKLAIAITSPDAASWRRVLEFTDPNLDLRFEPFGESRGRADRSMHPGLRVRWQKGGSPLAPAVPRPPGDAELQRRLEALGYLN